MTFLRCLAFIQKLKESVAELEQHHGYNRSENQSRESLGMRRNHAIYGIVVFWQTFVNGHISAVPRLKEEGTKSEDLQHGTEQSSLFDSLRLSSAVQCNSLLPERNCFISYPPQSHQDRINLLVGSQLEQAIGSLQAYVSCLQEDLGDGEAGHVGGN